MKFRPILFSAPMVRALLNGSKTQTRRVLKSQALEWISTPVGFDPQFIADAENRLSPYGQVGDQLWVRETFCDATDGLHGRVLYRATGDTACKWKPSIFMPRAASRITLEITGVRVEQLQDISDSDCKAEGVQVENSYFTFSHVDREHHHELLQGSYASLWESLNGAGSWDLNPWVWVIEFKKVKP